MDEEKQSSIARGSIVFPADRGEIVLTARDAGK
jgi:hypothetical protein